jgi:hypothetical protein
MRGSMWYVSVAVALVGLLGIALGLRYTSALFTDEGQSTGNTFSTGSLDPPELLASESGSSAVLDVDNVDPDTELITIERAPGTCAAPTGSFVVLADSPFTLDEFPWTDSPGAGGEYCYVARSARGAWLSAFGTHESPNQKTVTLEAP